MPTSPEYPPEQIPRDIANYLLEEVCGDNGCSVPKFYRDHPITFGHLENCVEANMPYINTLSEDDLTLIANGDMEMQVRDNDPDEDKHLIAELVRWRVIVKELPDYAILNEALERVFEYISP